LRRRLSTFCVVRPAQTVGGEQHARLARRIRQAPPATRNGERLAQSARRPKAQWTHRVNVPAAMKPGFRNPGMSHASGQRRTNPPARRTECPAEGRELFGAARNSA
jgi:hypothetical protein